MYQIEKQLSSIFAGTNFPAKGLIELIVPAGMEDYIADEIAEAAPRSGSVWFSCSSNLSTSPGKTAWTIGADDSPLCKLLAVLDTQPAWLLVEGLDALCADITGGGRQFMESTGVRLWPVLHRMCQVSRNHSCIVVLSTSYSHNIRAAGSDLNSIADYQIECMGVYQAGHPLPRRVNLRATKLPYERRNPRHDQAAADG